jgi:hypothetical protein
MSIYNLKNNDLLTKDIECDNIKINNNLDIGNIDITNIECDNIKINNELEITGNVISKLKITNTDESYNFSTGCLTCAGGVGVNKDVNIKGNTFIHKKLTIEGNNEESINPLTGGAVFDCGVGIFLNLNVGGYVASSKKLICSDTTTSLSTSTGAVVCSNGGVGCNNLYTSSLNVENNLYAENFYLNSSKIGYLQTVSYIFSDHGLSGYNKIYVDIIRICPYIKLFIFTGCGCQTMDGSINSLYIRRNSGENCHFMNYDNLSAENQFLSNMSVIVPENNIGTDLTEKLYYEITINKSNGQMIIRKFSRGTVTLTTFYSGDQIRLCSFNFFYRSYGP